MWFWQDSYSPYQNCIVSTHKGKNKNKRSLKKAGILLKWRRNVSKKMASMVKVFVSHFDFFSLERKGNSVELK